MSMKVPSQLHLGMLVAVVVGIVDESDGRGWWPQRSRGPGKIPKVKGQEARDPERKGDSVPGGGSIIKVVWSNLGPADPNIWL